MLIVGIVLAALLVTVSSASAEAEIWTDEDDYPPDSIVKISGSGFKPNTQLVQIDITPPNGAETDVCPDDVRCIGGALPTTDDEGDFLDYEYDLNGVEGLYTVTVSDGTGNVSETTFTDCVFKVKRPNGGEVWSDTETIRWFYAFGNWDTFEYKLYYKAGSCEGPISDWTEIATVTRNTKYMSYQWDTTSLCGVYCIGIKKTSGILKLSDKSDNLFTICNALGGLTGCSELLNDGFEGTPWNANWDFTSSNWFRSGASNSGFYSAGSSNGQEGHFACDPLDASSADAIRIDFWYRLDNTEKRDLKLYYYDGTHWDKIANLGDGSEDQWLHYTDTTGDPQYFHSEFRIRFKSNLGCGEHVWVDDVVIETCECDCGDPNIPEFATIALPALSVLGLFLFFNKRKHKKE